MVKKPKGPQLLTANRLWDGLVVFYAASGQWLEDAGRAAIAEGEQETARLEGFGGAAVKANLVVGPYLVELHDAGAPLRPVEHREQRRLAGPSVGATHKPPHSLAA